MKAKLITCAAIAPFLIGCEQEPQVTSGRYRIHSSEHGTVLLDSATGKTWIQVYAEWNEDQAPYWEPSARMDRQHEWQKYMELHPEKPTATGKQRFGPPKSK